MVKKVLWIIWPLASGKDALAEMISEQFHLPLYQISSPLKMIARDRGIEPDRTYLVHLGRELAEKYWDEYLARYLVENASDEVIILVGMRQIGQIEYLKTTTKFTLIWINADPKIRFERIQSRGKSWDPITWEEFQKIENLDNSRDAAQRIDACMEFANYIYENNGTIDELRKQIPIIQKISQL